MRFPAFERFESFRIETNDATMAILLGLRLGADRLKRQPTRRRGDFLPTLYPRIPDVGRLHRTVDDARSMMESGERYYAYMAISFALAVYQTFVTEVIALLRTDGKDSSHKDAARLYLGEIHPYLGSLGIHLPAVELEQFTLAVKIRNQVVHAAGSLGDLVATYSALSPGAKGAWTRRGGTALGSLSSGMATPLIASDVNATWAVTHYLARALNLELARLISRRTWATTLVNHYEGNVRRLPPRGPRSLRKLERFAKMKYEAVGLSSSDLSAALAAT